MKGISIKLRIIYPFLSIMLEASGIFAIAVILSGCEESSLNGCKAKSLSRQFELDPSHLLRMTAMVNFKIILQN